MQQFAGKIQEAVIHPSDQSGSFEVFLNDDLVYSKLKTGRLPHPGEVEGILLERVFKNHGK